MPYDFSVKPTKKTAKQKLAKTTIKLVNTFLPDGKAKYMGFSFDIINIVLGYLSKVDEETAKKAVEEMLNELTD